jgi:hypothetical protein
LTIGDALVTNTYSLVRITLAVFALILIGACASEPTVPTGPDAEMSFDGLTKVDNSKMGSAWVKPDLDLSGYTKILPVNAGIEYRAVKSVSRVGRRTSSTNEFPLDEKQKVKIEAAVTEVFQSEFDKIKYFTRADTPGPDTLIIVGKILDLVSNVPPEPMGRGDIYLTKVGEATLVLEIKDSQSGEMFARAIDRAGFSPAVATRSNVVTNTSELKRQARKWASLLVKRLDEIHKL